MLHIYLSNRLDDHRLGAAGARVPGYEVKLATPEGDPVRPGEEGVLLVRGDSSAPCYWRKPEKSRETMRDDWIDTGDRFVERDGYYYFRGRTDELVKISGQWVWPLEVERCLNEHPHVHECAVLATIAVFGFVEGVAVGMLATLALFVIRLSRVDVIAEEFTARDRRSTMLHSVPDRAILYDRGELLRGYRLRGYIFFGSAHPLIDELKRPLGESPPPSCILLDFAAVSGCDLSAVNVLCQFVQMAHRAGVRMVFSALSRQLEGSLRSNIPVEAREQIWFESDFDSGLERCEDLLITVAMRGPSGPKDDERGRLFERVAGKLERHLDEMVAFEELLERLEPWLEPCEYAQGETLSLQGEVRDGVQLLVSGLVSVHDAEGTRLHHCGPGDVLDPWAAFEDKNVASTTAIARTPCRTMMLTPVARASRVGRQRPDAEVLYLHYQSSAARRTGSGWRLNGRAEM